MSVKITGLNELLAELDKRLGKAKMKKLTDDALMAGAEVFVRELKRQFQTFKDTGASIDEITISEPFDYAGNRTIRIHWEGPKNRYRIIHLNEWGTVNNPNPRGKGKIAIALRNSEKAYREVVARHLREGI